MFIKKAIQFESLFLIYIFISGLLRRKHQQQPP